MVCGVLNSGWGSGSLAELNRSIGVGDHVAEKKGCVHRGMTEPNPHLGILHQVFIVALFTVLSGGFTLFSWYFNLFSARTLGRVPLWMYRAGRSSGKASDVKLG